MNTTNAVATIDINGAAAVAPSLPVGGVRVIYSKSGKVISREYAFDGKQSASELRKALKVGGHKSRAIDKMVREALASDEGARWVAFNATAAELRNRGMVPDAVKVSENGAGASMTLKKAVASVVERSEADARAVVRKEKVAEAAKAAGLTAEQVALIAAALN